MSYKEWVNSGSGSLPPPPSYSSTSHSHVHTTKGCNFERSLLHDCSLLVSEISSYKSVNEAANEIRRGIYDMSWLVSLWVCSLTNLDLS